MRKRAALASGLILLSAATTTRPSDGVIPFTVRELSGRRPIVSAALNGHALNMMVHSSAGFTVQINHAIAQEVGVTDIAHGGAFGIEGPGRLSALGRDEGRLATLTVGEVSDRDVPVSVFELPTPARVGMLGLGWIAKHGIIIDFDAGTMTGDASVEQRSGLRRRLSAAGYVSVPMRRDPTTGRYLVDVTIGGVTRPMVVSTVAGTVVDQGFGTAAGVGKGAQIGTYNGPKGSVGQVYAPTAAIRMSLAGRASIATSEAHIHDIYDYAGEARPTGGAQLRGGAIGPDALIPARAVVDFGDRTLFVRTASPAGKPDRKP